MTITTHHSRAKGLHRLIEAPYDLQLSERSKIPVRRPRRDEVPLAYRDLFEEYKGWLEGAIFFAIQRWEGMIEKRLDRGMDRAEAIEDLYAHNIAGPAACPQLVWTLREFWMRCALLNAERTCEERVPPQVFLLAWIDEEGGHDEWVQVMTAMPYWPIGLSESLDWC